MTWDILMRPFSLVLVVLLIGGCQSKTPTPQKVESVSSEAMVYGPEYSKPIEGVLGFKWGDSRDFVYESLKYRMTGHGPLSAGPYAIDNVDGFEVNGQDVHFWLAFSDDGLCRGRMDFYKLQGISHEEFYYDLKAIITEKLGIRQREYPKQYCFWFDRDSTTVTLLMVGEYISVDYVNKEMSAMAEQDEKNYEMRQDSLKRAERLSNF